MKEFHVPRKLRCLVELIPQTIRCRGKTFDEVTESFEVRKDSCREMP
jgi:hypothetical protein